MSEYYDVILGLIPLAFISISVGLAVTGFSLTTAVTLASVVAISLVGHALFVNAPVDAVDTVDPRSTTTPVDAE